MSYFLSIFTTRRNALHKMSYFTLFFLPCRFKSSKKSTQVDWCWHCLDISFKYLSLKPIFRTITTTNYRKIRLYWLPTARKTPQRRRIRNSGTELDSGFKFQIRMAAAPHTQHCCCIGLTQRCGGGNIGSGSGFGSGFGIGFGIGFGVGTAWLTWQQQQQHYLPQSPQQRIPGRTGSNSYRLHEAGATTRSKQVWKTALQQANAIQTRVT